MNYDAIINSTYNWFSLQKLVWFLAFFWISIPLFVFFYYGLEMGLFVKERIWFVNSLYFIIYFALFVGFFVLTYHCLKKKNLDAKDISITKFFDGILLVLMQLWHIFVWNIHKPYRITQLLILFGLPLLWFYSSYLNNWFVNYSLFLFGLFYFVFVLYNWIRTSFSLTYFLSHDCSIKYAINESWKMTHKKFLKTLFAYFIIFASISVLFIAGILIFGAVVSLLLLNYFVPSIANNLALLVAFFVVIAPILISYYFAYIELYSQLFIQNKTSIKIKNLLADRILNNSELKQKSEKSATRKSLKKKVKKKKSVKRKK